MSFATFHGELWDLVFLCLFSSLCVYLIQNVYVALQGEGCSLFPEEMECFYGDAYLCKVEKRDPVDFDEMPAFNVVSVCSEVDVVNMFFDEFIPDFDLFVSLLMHVCLSHRFSCYILSAI
jgi:hypothetical protein